MPSLETVYIDARMLDAAEALGETPFEIICLDTPVYRYIELVDALSDPLVTEVCIMKTITVPRGEEIRIPSSIVLTERSEDLSISIYGTVRVGGVWEMNCKQYNYGTILIENGGVCLSKATATVHCGAFQVEKGGRHNLRDGATFTFVGGSYENNGIISLQGELHILYKDGGSLVNNGALYLRAADYFESEFDIPYDRIVNKGIVYVDGISVLDGTKSSKEQSGPTEMDENQAVD